jgi:hypothetical protein
MLILTCSKVKVLSLNDKTKIENLRNTIYQNQRNITKSICLFSPTKDEKNQILKVKSRGRSQFCHIIISNKNFRNE